MLLFFEKKKQKHLPGCHPNPLIAENFVSRGDLMWIFGKSGIIKANLKAYFKARKQGFSVDQSLTWIVRSRYPDSFNHQSTVMEQYLDLEKLGYSLETEEEKVVALIKTIVEYETPSKMQPMPDWEGAEKLKIEISDLYHRMSN
jgi:hypothetical protein